MSPKESSHAELETKNELEAEVLGFLFNRIPFFDRETGKYKMLREEEIQSKIKDFYDEDRYKDADELIDSYDDFSSLNPEKEFRELKSKSFRLSEADFVKAVKKAYDNNSSVADLLRSNITSKLKTRVEEFYQDADIEDSKIDLITEIVENWGEKEGRSPLRDGYTLGWEVPYSRASFIDAYEEFSKYLVKKEILEQHLDDEKLIDIYSDYYNSDEEGFFENMELKIGEEDDELKLFFNWSFSVWFTPTESLDILNDFLSDVANEGYTKDELEGSIFLDDFPTLVNRIQRIRENKDHGIGTAKGRLPGSAHERAEISRILSFPKLSIKWPLEVKDDSLKCGEIPLQEGELQEPILNEILGSELQSLNVEEAKERVEKSLEKRDTGTARKINQRISTYKSSEELAGTIEKIILNGLSSQVVSLTMPKAVSGLLKIFDIQKSDLLGD